MTGPDAPQPDPESGRDDRVDAYVGWTLFGGVLLSMAVMVLGLALVGVEGEQVSGHVLPLDRVVPDVLRGKPSAILDLGILLLFATPLVGVLVAAAEYIRLRNAVFVLISLALLIVLVGGFAVALR